MSGEADLCIRNFQPNPFAKKSNMRKAELAVAEGITPCIIRRVTRGNIENLDGRSKTLTVMVFGGSCHTPYTKKGYVDVLITTDSTQFHVYIHTGCLQHFFGAIAMATIRTALK